MSFIVRERNTSPSWPAYAGWILMGIQHDRVVAELPSQAEAVEMACKLNLESGGARAAWNNSKQHLKDFLIVYTTHARFADSRRYYVDTQ